MWIVYTFHLSQSNQCVSINPYESIEFQWNSKNNTCNQKHQQKSKNLSACNRFISLEKQSTVQISIRIYNLQYFTFSVICHAKDSLQMNTSVYTCARPFIMNSFQNKYSEVFQFRKLTFEPLKTINDDFLFLRVWFTDRRYWRTWCRCCRWIWRFPIFLVEMCLYFQFHRYHYERK